MDGVKPDTTMEVVAPADATGADVRTVAAGYDWATSCAEVGPTGVSDGATATNATPRSLVRTCMTTPRSVMLVGTGNPVANSGASVSADVVKSNRTTCAAKKGGDALSSAPT